MCHTGGNNGDSYNRCDTDDNDMGCGDKDSSPFDKENDKDGKCADVGAYPLDKYNGGNGDGLCAHEDPCPKGSHNDADSDRVCSDKDNCQIDKDINKDEEGLCTFVHCKKQRVDGDDKCPTVDHTDGDEVCDTNDKCPLGTGNDVDGSLLHYGFVSCERGK